MCMPSVVLGLQVSGWHVDSYSWDKVPDFYSQWKSSLLMTLKPTHVQCCHFAIMTNGVYAYTHWNSDTHLRSKPISAGCGVLRRPQHLFQISYQNVAQFCFDFLFQPFIVRKKGVELNARLQQILFEVSWKVVPIEFSVLVKMIGEKK